MLLSLPWCVFFAPSLFGSDAGAAPRRAEELDLRHNLSGRVKKLVRGALSARVLNEFRDVFIQSTGLGEVFHPSPAEIGWGGFDFEKFGAKRFEMFIPPPHSYLP